MATLDSRVRALEAQGDRATGDRLVLLAPHGRLSEADQARAEAARAAGHDVVVLELVAPAGKPGHACQSATAARRP